MFLPALSGIFLGSATPCGGYEFTSHLLSNVVDSHMPAGCPPLCVRSFWEPDWDLADAEMLVEVNYTSENQQQQKLQDLRVGAGIRACANQQGSIMEMLQWFTRHKDPQSSTRDKPINITARDRDVAGIVMVLSRVGAHIQAEATSIRLNRPVQPMTHGCCAFLVF